MSSKIYRHQGRDVDLARVTRLYPAVMINAGGESASVSLEWAELKKEVITLECYVLICDFDPIGDAPVNRVELKFDTKEELFSAMQDVSKLFNA